MVHDVADQVLDGLAHIAVPHASGMPGPGASVIHQIAGLCANTVADVCLIYLRDQSDAPAAFASRNPELYARLAQSSDDALPDVARQCGIISLQCEPLVCEGRALGTLVLGYTSQPAALAQHVYDLIATIISLAIAQERELAHHYHVSTRLQKAMLPARLATIPGLACDAAYRPASAEAEVGGDWYDVFDVGNGTFGISVGDVMGHGLEAAVFMSEIRRAIRAAISTSNSPSTVLNHVDSVISSEKGSLATAIVGTFDPGTSLLRYASAGHPAPAMLTGGGRALFLPGGGLLLGLGASPASPDFTVSLSPGTSCFFYTDGLLEYHRDVIEGERLLLAALEELFAHGLPSADGLHAEIFRDAVNTDDCATLALHAADQHPTEELHLTYSAVPMCAAIAREAMRHYTERAGVKGDSAFAILAAIGEAVANAIEHSEVVPGGTFTIDARVDADRIIANVESIGHWQAFNPRFDRGRGIPIMRACTQALEISSMQDRTRVTLTFAR